MQQSSRFEAAEEKLVDVVYYTNPFDPRLFSGLCHLIPSARDGNRQHRADVNIFLSYPLASELLEAELTEYRMAVAGLKGSAQAGGASAKSEKTDSSTASASARCDIDSLADRRPSPSSANFCDESDAALKIGEYVSKDDAQISRRFNGRQFLLDQSESLSSASGKAANFYINTDAAETHMDARTLANEIGSAAFAHQHLLAKRCDTNNSPSERGYAFDGQAEMAEPQFARASSRDYKESSYETGFSGKLSASNRIKSLSDPNLYSAWMQAAANAKDSNARGHVDDESNHVMAPASVQSGCAWPRGSRATDGTTRGQQQQQFLPAVRNAPHPTAQAAYTADSSYRAALSAIAAASTAGSRQAGRVASPGNSNAYQWPNSCWVYDERNRPVFISGCHASAYAQHSRLQYVPFSLPQIRTGMPSTSLAGHALRQFSVPQHANVVRYGHLLQRNYASNTSGLPAAGCGGSFVQFPLTCRSSAASQPIKQTAYAHSFAKYLQQTGLTSSATQAGGQYHMCGGPGAHTHPDQFKPARQSVAGLQSVQELANLRAAYKQLHQDPVPVSSSAAGLATAVAAAAAADSAAAAASTERALAALNEVLNNKGFDECLSCNHDGRDGVASAYAYLDARDAAPYDIAHYGPLKAEREPATTCAHVAGVAKETPTALDLLQQEFKLSLSTSADDAASSSASLAGDVARSCATHAADRRLTFHGLPAAVNGMSMDEAGCLASVPTACGAAGGADLSAAAGYARALNFQTIRTKKGIVQRLTFGGGYC